MNNYDDKYDRVLTNRALAVMHREIPVYLDDTAIDAPVMVYTAGYLINTELSPTIN